MQVPASRYQPSGRSFPERLPALEYDIAEQVGKVSDRGIVKYRKYYYFLGNAFIGEYVGLRPQAAGGRHLGCLLWKVHSLVSREYPSSNRASAQRPC
jgi:hypothetical protein